MKGIPLYATRLSVYDSVEKSSQFIVLGTGCLICLQMWCYLISIPLHKLKQLSQRGSESRSVPANVGWTPPRKVLCFTLAKNKPCGPGFQIFLLMKSQL